MKLCHRKFVNIAEFEPLCLGLDQALQLGCKQLHVFGDLELIINMVKMVWHFPHSILFEKRLWVFINLILEKGMKEDFLIGVEW